MFVTVVLNCDRNVYPSRMLRIDLSQQLHNDKAVKLII